MTKNTIFHVPNIRVINTANTDKELKVSHHIIVLFGFHLSANVPPIKEKMKIGANSATEIIEIAKASPFVISITYSNTAKFRTHIPICKNNADARIPCTNRFFNTCDTPLFCFISTFVDIKKPPISCSEQEAAQII
ncbi:Uncharacterised protein [Streptococcus pneumoniae]|nr:Uncharacterised protein [Streptococcus pneumoniae]